MPAGGNTDASSRSHSVATANTLYRFRVSSIAGSIFPL